VWSEGALFARESQFFHRAFHAGGELFEIGRGLDAYPENSRAARVWEESESFDLDGKFSERGEGFESLGHLCGLPLGDFAEELQGQMDVLRELRPNVCLTQGGSGAECRLPFPQGDVDLLRHLDGDKRAHEFGVRDGMRLKMPIEGFLGRTVANQRSST